MRIARCLILTLALGACRFGIDGVDLGARDMKPSGGDLGPSPDMVFGGDMACGMACPFGCALTPTPHCKSLQPIGVVTAGDYGAAGLTAQTATGNVVFNTDTGEVTGGITRAGGSGVIGGIGYRNVAQMGGAPNVGVFAVAGLTLPANMKLTFTGAAAFALASAGDVTIAGTVDASCSRGVVGPGGSAGGAGGSDGSGSGGGKAGASMPGMNPVGGAGGGGAGFGDIGGTGAAGMAMMTTPSGGIYALEDASGTLVLVGGSGGGGGGNMGAAGGGGGGAIQFSIDGALSVSGTIDAGGCGGAAGSSGAGGGGGGSGGAIVLEAATITLTPTAIIASNGGGGSGGDAGGVGGDALPSTTAAAGGAPGDNGGGGGSGGARGPRPGVHNTEGTNAPVPKMGPPINFGGGGGGGTGRILFRSTTQVNDQAMAVSPDFVDINHLNLKMTTTEVATFQ
jgi:hypothetical protein